MNAVEKTLAVLEAIAAPGTGHRLADIATRAAIPKPTTHRILQILGDRGYVLSNHDGTYAVGPEILSLAGGVLTHRDFARLARPATLALQEQTGHTVHFAIRSGESAIYIDKVESPQPYRMASRVGMRIPLHCTAIGKAILATLPPAEGRLLLGAAPLVRRTENTRCTVDALMADLDEVRARGFSIDDEENELGVRCVGAPVHDSLGTVVGGVSTSALTFALTPADALSLGPIVSEGARRISACLGARDGDGAR